MNSPQQVAAVKDIIRIKNKIFNCSDWDEIADLVQQAIDISAAVPPNDALDTLDRTKSKGWNIISLKRLITSLRERNFPNLETVYTDVAASLLRLAMVFVENGLTDVNKILSESLLSKGIFQQQKKNTGRQVNHGDNNFEDQ